MCFFKRKKKKEETKVKEEVKAVEKVEETQVVSEKKEPATSTTAKAKGTQKKATTTKPKSASTKKVASKKETKTEEPKEEQTESKPARKAVYRVVYDKDARLWTIKKDGAKRKIASFVTKKEALERVEELATSNDIRFVVHKKDGKFQKK